MVMETIAWIFIIYVVIVASVLSLLAIIGLVVVGILAICDKTFDVKDVLTEFKEIEHDKTDL